MPMTRRGRSCPAKPGDHAGVRAAGHGADDDRVEEDAHLLLLLLDLVGPVGEAEAAEPVVGRARRDAVRLAAARADVVERLVPAVAEADVEARRVEPDLGPHDPRQQDVADAVVDGVGPVDPRLLHEDGLEAELRGDRGHLTGVVGLHAADRHERVGALGERVGDDVLELAGLVAAEGQAAVDVLTLGPDLRAAEVRAQPRQRVDRAGPEHQRIAREVLEGHGHSFVGRVDPDPTHPGRPGRSSPTDGTPPRPPLDSASTSGCGAAW